ncbi:MAG: molybdenum cofactor guanylyltransferase, partial [Candidatus Omnitrophica bacterium]|nr:molybdenum cofactor guanylyltransferase [Candidatus Omnitrophota bacterium]
MTAIILAGGKGKRMHGRDKAFLRIKGEPIIKRQLRLLKRIFKQIIVVTNFPEKYKDFRGIKIISDIVPYAGPLGGIYSGLSASKDKYNFVLACDMPFINLSLLKYMQGLCKGYDVVVPKIKKRYQPLYAFYAQDCLPKIEISLKKINLKVFTLYSRLNVREVSESEVRRFGKPELIFKNINTLG